MADETADDEPVGPAAGPVGRQRLDKWLFFTRMAKSRSIAQGWIASGHVGVNGQSIRQPAHLVKAGDRVEIRVERRHHILVVVDGGKSRGPFDVARKLYEDHSPPQQPKLTPFEQAQRTPGAGRPTKKDRRATDRLLSDD